jgi:hypothetical protein
MALGALGYSLVEGLDRVQGHAALGDEGLDHEGIGRDDALIGGQWGRALNGMYALVDDIGVAYVMVTKEAL